MKIAVPNESAGGERRVALVPDVIKRLSGKGHEVVVEAGVSTSDHIAIVDSWGPAPRPGPGAPPVAPDGWKPCS